MSCHGKVAPVLQPADPPSNALPSEPAATGSGFKELHDGAGARAIFEQRVEESRRRHEALWAAGNLEWEREIAGARAADGSGSLRRLWRLASRWWR